MLKLSSRVFLVVILSVNARGQQPIPPEEATPASIAFQVSQRRQAWTEYEPGLMSTLFTADPAIVEEKLRNAATLMRAYKDAEIRLYSALSGAIERDIRSLEGEDDSEWKRYIEGRPKIITRQLATLRDQELNLQEQIADLEGRQDSQSRGLASSLKRSLRQLQDLQQQLNAYRTDLDRGSVLDSAPTRTAALRSLRAQYQQMSRLREIASESRDELEVAYTNARLAVQAHSKSQAPAARTSAQQPAPQAAAGVLTAPGSSTAGSLSHGLTGTWTRVLGQAYSRERPYRIDFFVISVISDSQGSVLQGRFLVWFSPGPAVAVPDIALDCRCAVDRSRLNCSASSSGWKGVILLRGDEPITRGIPDALHLESADLDLLASTGAREKWKLAGTTVIKKSASGAMQTAAQPGRTPVAPAGTSTKPVGKQGTSKK
jgi:hypothetical protein